MVNKIVLLSNANSIHTIQWAKNLVEQGNNIHVVSQQPKGENFPEYIPLTVLPFKGFLGYFFNVIPLKKLLKQLNPDLLNVHYASGYGTTARLVNFHPYVLSVWGSDVFEFPYRSLLHKVLLTRNLQNADIIASTSQSMATQTKLFIDESKTIEITPFGVDFDKFNLSKQAKIDSEFITIGTVKTLKHVYGIDILIKAFSIIYKKLQVENSPLFEKIRFRVVGGGPDLDMLRKLATELEIIHITTFVGPVSHENVPEELSKLDIYVALSRQESFGVAVLEAQAMRLPVVVSNVGGLPEVVKHGETGYLVETENPDQAAEMIIKLIVDQELRDEFAINAENFVRQEFSWKACVQQMQKVFQNTLVSFKKRVNL